MLKPRHHFALVVLGTTLLAFGGSNETSIELWEGEGKSWKEASISLPNARRQFSALSYSDLECVDGSWPAHSCPTVDEDACVFPFTNGRPHKNLCIFLMAYRVLQDLKPSPPVSVTRTRASFAQVKRAHGPSVTPRNVLLTFKVILILYQNMF